MKATSTGNILPRGSYVGMYQGQKIELQIEKVKKISSYITEFFFFFLMQLGRAWHYLFVDGEE